MPIAIAGGHDRTVKRVRRTIEETGYFMVLGDGLKPGAAARMVMQGEALIGIELPTPDDSDADAQVQEPKVIVDATDPSAVRPALAALESGYWQRVAELYAIGPVPSVDVEWLYNPAGRPAWTIVPGLAGVVVMISMLMLGALTLVREIKAPATSNFCRPSKNTFTIGAQRLHLAAACSTGGSSKTDFNRGRA